MSKRPRPRRWFYCAICGRRTHTGDHGSPPDVCRSCGPKQGVEKDDILRLAEDKKERY
jgi:ribosome-binding protein aMBF1 (putative translation factor)